MTTLNPDAHAHAVRNEMATVALVTHGLANEAGGDLTDALLALASIEGLVTATRRALLELPPVAETLPPVEAEQPCFKCHRTGPLVMDRYPHQPGMRNHPERFMHWYGVCPEPPSPTEPEPAGPKRFDVRIVAGGVEVFDGREWQPYQRVPRQ